MITISKILIPTVIAPSSIWAARLATQLARRIDSKLIFAHIGYCEPGQIEEFLRAPLEDAPHELVIRPGEPGEILVQLSRELAVDLILMPTHAHGRFRRFLLGSVTAKVLHDADCPVLTGVHREDQPLNVSADFGRILCAVDAGESFATIVRWALEFQALFNSALTVIHAVPTADQASDNRGEVEVRRYLFGQARQKFNVLCRQANVNLEVSLAGGPIDQIVREAALRENAGLVIIGRGHTQRELGRLRTHAYSIIRNSPCPVLSI